MKDTVVIYHANCADGVAAATVLPTGMALYANPQPPRQPLTDEQIANAVRPLYQSDFAAGMGLSGDIDIARLIERAHGIGGEA